MAKATPAGLNTRVIAAKTSQTRVPSPFDDVTLHVLPANANALLAQAVTKLKQGDPDACELFAFIANNYNVREAWLCLAVAHHLRAEATLAGKALSHALSHYTVTNVPLLADSITKELQMPGWCALDGQEILTVRLLQTVTGRPCLTANLDGKRLFLRAKPDGRTYFGRLPIGWRYASEIKVFADDVALLGSPIMLRAIGRVEGFLDSLNGDLHGWAWFPNDPDRDPQLTIVPVDGGPGITLIAADQTINIDSPTPLARPRSFHVPADRLLGFEGAVRVYGPDGRDLMGSPIYPSEERRSAEVASRIVARLFPAPGRIAEANLQHLRFPSALAHVTGGPVHGGRKKRSVDVIVPVYGNPDLTLACLHSLLVDLPRWARIVVVDDASPDPQIGNKLAKLARERRITLLTQTVNRGFPKTVNIGMRHDATRDVVLLNSDTLVPPGWLARLREAAYSAPNIGTATPISNDATILSYPNVERSNAVPNLSDTVHLDALAQSANAGRLVDIPTAIGFCAFIKRDCLIATGLLREDVFAQGYGEENDFCIRARHLGWRHVAVPTVFVAHVGGQSFGLTKYYLIRRNMRKLNQLHPGYDALIREFQSVDPMADARRQLDMERWKTFRASERSVLLITHGRSGGVQRHVAERAIALRSDGFRPILLWPAASRDGDGHDCILGNGPEGGTPNLRFAIPAELNLLARILKADRPVRGEVHHMIGHHHQMLDLFKLLRIPYEITVHDYSWLCPRINLVGISRRYCGEPDLTECEACVTAVGSLNDENVSPRTLRERSALELAGASNVVVPSQDVAIRIRRHFSLQQLRIVNWEDDSLLALPNPSPLAPDGIRRVCVVGAIGIEKGYDILLACARDAADRKLNLRFHLVGYSCNDAHLTETGKVYITGHYDEQKAVTLIRQQQAQLAWLTSLWPETWCYTLTHAWQAGLNVMAFNIGTQSERIRRTGRGWLYPLGLTPQALNNQMLTLRPMETDIASLLLS